MSNSVMISSNCATCQSRTRPL